MRPGLKAINWQGFSFCNCVLLKLALYCRLPCHVFCICMLGVDTYKYKSVPLGNQLCFISNHGWLKISPDLWSWTNSPLGEWILFFLWFSLANALSLDKMQNSHLIGCHLYTLVQRIFVQKGKLCVFRLFKNGVKVFDRSPRPAQGSKQFGFVGKTFKICLF